MSGKKDKQISFKVSEKEYASIQKAARENGETVSGYARGRMQKKLTDGWIKKTEVQESLSKISAMLDRKEEKNRRVAEPIRKEVAKLWKKL